MKWRKNSSKENINRPKILEIVLIITIYLGLLFIQQILMEQLLFENSSVL